MLTQRAHAEPEQAYLPLDHGTCQIAKEGILTS